MPIPAYMTLDGIKGPSKVEGREDQVEILQFHHRIHMPTDIKTGITTGTRVHGHYVVTKLFDKASPVLYQYLCNGKQIPKVQIDWYQIDSKTGKEEIYFTHTLENVRVAEIIQQMPNVDNPQNENLRHMEQVSLSYEKITWDSVDGSTSAEDSWVGGR